MKKGYTKGWSPTGMAAAAIYLASFLSGESVEAKEIAKVAGTTPITLKNRHEDEEKAKDKNRSAGNLL